MLPSRGLRPHQSQFASAVSRQSRLARSNSARQFSSIPRRNALPSVRPNPLGSSNWRAGAALAPNVRIEAASVRYGSWYAPWSWGKTSAPADASATSPSAVANGFAPDAVNAASEPTVTSATPEMAPGGIDKAAAVNDASASSEPASVEELLGLDPTPIVDATPAADVVAPISYWGNLKDLGLDYGWGTSAFFENLMELSYLNLDAGWVGSIFASAITLRLILFFGFQVRGSDSMAKMAAMKPILQPLMEQMEEAKRMGDDEKVQLLKLKQQGIMKEVSGDIFKNLGTPIAGMVTGFGAFRCLRGMSEMPVPGMSTETFLWINDLTVADPTYLLPVLTGGMMYAVIKTGGETGVNNEAAVTSMQKKMAVVLPVVMTVITAFQPAAVQLYFLISSFLAGTTALSLKQPAIRRFLGIRTLPTPESHELFSKVVKGDIPLSGLRGPDGRIRYQAPNSTGSSSSSSRSANSSKQQQGNLGAGLGTLKPGTQLPAHMSPLTASFSARTSAKENKGSVASLLTQSEAVEGESKWDALKRQAGGVAKLMKEKLDFDNRYEHVKEMEAKKQRMARAAQQYEEARRRRLEGR